MVWSVSRGPEMSADGYIEVTVSIPAERVGEFYRTVAQMLDPQGVRAAKRGTAYFKSPETLEAARARGRARAARMNTERGAVLGPEAPR